MKRYSFLSLLFVFFITAASASNKYQAGVTPAYQKSKLADYPTEQLLHYLSVESLNWHYEREDSEWFDLDIIDELIKRKPISELFLALKYPEDNSQENYVVRTLYQIQDPLVTRGFKKLVSTDLSEKSYYVLNYLAKEGDIEALKTLNDNFFKYSVSSYQWADTVTLFGKFKFYGATDNLVDILNAASLNLSGAAIEALLVLYPNAPQDFEGPSDAEQKMRAYVSKLRFENIEEE